MEPRTQGSGRAGGAQLAQVTARSWLLGSTHGGEELPVSRQAGPIVVRGQGLGGPPWSAGPGGEEGHRGLPGRQGTEGRHLGVQVALLEFKLPGPSRLLPAFGVIQAPPAPGSLPLRASLTLSSVGTAFWPQTRPAPSPSLASPAAAMPSLASSTTRSHF